MAKSALYAVNTTSQSVAVGGTIAVGQAVRRFGCNANVSGQGIAVRDGYFDIAASVTLTPAAAGAVTITLLDNGVAVPGASSTITAAAADPITLTLIGIVKDRGGCGFPVGSNLTLQLTGQAATVSNVAVTVVKL